MAGGETFHSPSSLSSLPSMASCILEIALSVDAAGLGRVG